MVQEIKRWNKMNVKVLLWDRNRSSEDSFLSSRVF